jgi:hypothetical protein
MAAGRREELGVDAFEAEAPEVMDDAAGTGAQRTRLVMMALAAVVVLEAIPATLWVRGRFAAEPPVASVAAPPLLPDPIPIVAAATVTCAPTSAAATATTGSTENPKPAAPRPAPAGLMAGLLSVTGPVPMHVYLDGRLVGRTDAETIMLPVGEHDLEFVSESAGFRTSSSVVVQAGRTAAIQLDAPRVPVHVNAIPWAEVWIDNQRVGETPIGNLQQTIGSHEVIFRHPELGERRTMVMVTMKEPARISMDMRKR